MTPRPIAARLLRRQGRLLPISVRPRLPLGDARPQYRPRALAVPRAYQLEREPDPAPTISIVTPSLNQGRFLERSLRSVHEQRYSALEHVVMDGGSTDASTQIITSFADRIHHWESGPDAGQAAAINAGFAHTGGEIMAWLNSDDLLLPGALAHVARTFAQNPQLELLYGFRVLIDEQDRDIGVEVPPPHSSDILRWFDFLPQDASFWRRRLWERCGGLDERLEIAFDWDLFCRFQASGAEIGRTPRFLSAYRQHAGQKTRAQRQRLRAEQAQIRRRIHGRDISIEEARQGAVRLMLRATPRSVWERLKRCASTRGSGGGAPWPGETN